MVDSGASGCCILFSAGAPFGRDSDTILTRWYSKHANVWGVLFSPETPFGKESERIRKNKEFKQIQSGIAQPVRIVLPVKGSLPDEFPRGDSGVEDLMH